MIDPREFADIDRQREAQQAREQLAADQYAVDLRTLTAQPAGRRVLAHLLQSTGLHRSTFTGDPLSGAFHEGKRAVGLQLADDLKAYAIDDYLLMLKEHNV